MIKIIVYKNENNIYNGFCVSGHAEYNKQGQDIICASVSALVINTMNSIKKFTKDTVSINCNDKLALRELKITGTISMESQLLLKSLFLGLQAIKQEYGSKYIKFKKN